MCRLLGIVASEPTAFRLCLREAPRSLGCLSREHPDGWGIAVYRSGRDWIVEKNPICAGDDRRFQDLAAGCLGEILIGHVRKRTVGDVTMANTHPFMWGRWIFAHNGTIHDLDFLRSRITPDRLAGLSGQTDSELLFAYLLSALDEVGITDRPASVITDRALVGAIRRLSVRSDFGSWNFILSDGEALYAYRSGRDLHLLVRESKGAPRTVPSADTGIIVDARDMAGHRAVLVASEPITDEFWTPIEEGTLLRIERSPDPELRFLFRQARESLR